MNSVKPPPEFIEQFVELRALARIDAIKNWYMGINTDSFGPASLTIITCMFKEVSTRVLDKNYGRSVICGFFMGFIADGNSLEEYHALERQERDLRRAFDNAQYNY